MRGLRAFLIVITVLVGSRLIGESLSCGLDSDICSYFKLLIFPFFISLYFMESAIQDLEKSETLSFGDSLKYALVLPYVYIVFIYVFSFFDTFKLGNIEDLFNKYIVVLIPLYGVFYWANSNSRLRKINQLLMPLIAVIVVIYYFI